MPLDDLDKEENHYQKWRFDIAFSQGTETRLNLDVSYDGLEEAVNIMRQFKIDEHKGRRLKDLETQLIYAGRTFLKRTFKTTVSNGVENQLAGIDLNRYSPSLPSSPRLNHLTFELVTANELRRLIFTIRSLWTDRDRPNYITGTELHCSFNQPSSGGSLSVGVEIQKRKTQYDPFQGVRYARATSYRSKWPDIVGTAYTQGGVTQVWKAIDHLWLDLISSAPKRYPLKPPSLEARYRLHHGHPVKLFTKLDTFVGTWAQTTRNGNRQISSVRLDLADEPGMSIDVRPEEIYELLPCRLEFEV